MADLKILIVEDERIVAIDIQVLLRKFGYDETYIAFSGKDAIEKFVEIKPDLVLMDIRLKGDLDGIETAERIQSRFHTPIIYISALSDEITLERVKQTKPLFFFSKPVKNGELEAAIKKVVSMLNMQSKPTTNK